MRLFTKIFLLGMLVFGLAFSVSGYFLLHYSLESSMAREVDFALKQYQYDKFTVQSAMLTYSDVVITFSIEDDFPSGAEQVYIIRQTAPFIMNYSEGEGASGVQWYLQDKGAVEDSEGAEGQRGGGLDGWSGLEDSEGTEGRSGLDENSLQGQVFPEGWIAVEDGMIQSSRLDSLLQSLAEEISSPAAFFSEDMTPIYSEIEGVDPFFLEGLSEDMHVYQFRNTPGGGSVLVGSIVSHREVPLTGNGGEMIGGAADSLEAGAGDTAGRTETGAGDTAGRTETGAGGTANRTETGAGGTANRTETGAEKKEWDSLSSAAEGRPVYFVTEWDISKTIQQQDTMQQYFMRCYAAAMGAGMVLLGILSALLTRPLKRMSKAARRMAEGDYAERVAGAGRDEISALAVSFNQMADAVEEKIEELSKAAREKEDFVANFAHELKTPLTSIIGYADTMYQKELTREEIRKASWHIWNEGMRLEALSFKLMDLTILGRQEFPLEEMAAEELLQDAVDGLKPLLAEKNIDFRLEAAEAYVRADYDLLKTLLINLVDNAVKAGSSRIEVSGKIEEEKYCISVEDNGCGMKEEEISRITEAFYMVDKARSRQHHGAGLGLALADRIAGLHGGGLVFESREGRGTKVSFSLICEKDEGRLETGAEGVVEQEDENAMMQLRK